MLNKNFARRFIPDLIFALGIVLLITGIFMLKQPEIPSEVTPATVKIQYGQGIGLNYPRFTGMEEKIEVNIPRGSTAITVGTILEEKGLMDFEEFRNLLVLFDFQGRIKAGQYIFDSGTSSGEILSRILLDG